MAIYDTFSKIFGKSPIKPIQRHMATVQEAVELLEPFIRAVIGEDWQTASSIHQSIVKLENKADDLKREIRSQLPDSLFLPVSRGDLLALLRSQDKIANKAKDIAGLILGRRMVFPKTIVNKYAKFLECCISASLKAKAAICELDELLETAFRGKEVKTVENMINELDDIEHHTDEMQIEIRQELFTEEKNLDPVNVVFLYKIIEWTGDLADKAQTVGNQIQLLIAK